MDPIDMIDDLVKQAEAVKEQVAKLIKQIADLKQQMVCRARLHARPEPEDFAAR